MGSVSVKTFIDAAEKGDERLAEKAAGGHPVIGYFCNYTPVELVHACGFIPVRLTGGPGPLNAAYNLLPDFVCPFLKRVTEKALNGGFDYISGVVQGYTCDAACGVLKVWEKNTAGRIFDIIPFPYTDNRDSRTYFRRALLSVVEKLEGLGGKFSEPELEKSMILYSRIRQKLDALYESRYERKLSLSAEGLWHVVRAGEMTPPEEYLEMLESFKGPEGREPDGLNQKFPVMVSGSLVEDGEVFKMIEHCGGAIVADDLCTGLRAAGGIYNKNGNDPFENLIDMHFNRLPCPSRASAEDRFKKIDSILKRSGAVGVVFLHQKFCSPHLSDLPYLSGRLKEKGIRSIQIEMDETWKTEGQFSTRMESFFEMLGQNDQG